MAKEIEFEDVIAYVNEMGTEDHLAMFLPEERHEEFMALQDTFSKSLERFKETVRKWADESHKDSRTLEEITILLKKGVKSPAAFVQQIEQLTGVKAKQEG